MPDPSTGKKSKQKLKARANEPALLYLSSVLEKSKERSDAKRQCQIDQRRKLDPREIEQTQPIENSFYLTPPRIALPTIDVGGFRRSLTYKLSRIGSSRRRPDFIDDGSLYESSLHRNITNSSSAINWHSDVTAYDADIGRAIAVGRATARSSDEVSMPSYISDLVPFTESGSARDIGISPTSYGGSKFGERGKSDMLGQNQRINDTNGYNRTGSPFSIRRYYTGTGSSMRDSDTSESSNLRVTN